MDIARDWRSQWAARRGDDFLAQIEAAEIIVSRRIDRRLSRLLSGSRFL
jgi:hypothetical protein